MVREWFTKKATQTIETTVVEPAKKAIQKSAETGSDWLTKLLRLGIVGFLTILAFREDPRSSQGNKIPESTQVVVNNYFGERSKEHDSEH